MLFDSSEIILFFCTLDFKLSWISKSSSFRRFFLSNPLEILPIIACLLWIQIVFEAIIASSVARFNNSWISTTASIFWILVRSFCKERICSLTISMFVMVSSYEFSSSFDKLGSVDKMSFWEVNFSIWASILARLPISFFSFLILSISLRFSINPRIVVFNAILYFFIDWSIKLCFSLTSESSQTISSIILSISVVDSFASLNLFKYVCGT